MKTRTIIALIAGIAGYVIASRLIALGILISLVIGLAVFILFRRTVTFILDRIAAGKAKAAPGAADILKIVAEGVEKLKNIRNNTRKIENNQVAEKIAEICRVGLDIMEDIKTQPGDLQRAKPFLNYYLDATNKIVSQYVSLSQNKSAGAEIKESLARVEGMLDQILETYRKQLQYLMEDDVLDLNTEISVLEKTMKMEG